MSPFQTSFQSLNDYCLLEILSVSSLGLMDLCSVAETCLRFRQIIGLRVVRKLKFTELYGGNCEIKSGNYKLSTSKYGDMEKIFSSFGSFLLSVSISNTNRRSDNIFGSFLLQLVAEHCDGCLEKLKISNLKIPKSLTAKLKSTFQRLRVLKLELVWLKDETLLDDCSSLVELRVLWSKNCSSILESGFQRLERFEYGKRKMARYNSMRYPNRERTLAALLVFISSHTSLKRLSLSFPRCDDRCKSDIVQTISDSCKQLEELAIWVGRGTLTSSNLQPLAALKSLRTLSLHGAFLQDFQFAKPMTALRELRLCLFRLPNDYSQFQSLTQLTQLELNGKMHQSTRDAFDVVGIVSRLTHLEKLRVHDRRRMPFVLDEETYSKLIVMVERRVRALTLNCKFSFKNCDENRMVRLLPIDAI